MALSTSLYQARSKACLSSAHAPSRSMMCVRCSAVSEPKAQSTAPEGILSTLKQAASKPGSVPQKEVLKAIVALEKERLKPSGEEWLKAISSPKARWQLVYTAASKDVTAASKGQQAGAGGYFPITACQKFDASEDSFENGVFLGPIASLTFKGPFAMDGKLLHFDVTKMSIGLGGWRGSFDIKKDAKPLKGASQKEKKKMPFFVYAYADADIIVARGRSGGVALWKNMERDSEWQARSGVLQVFG